MALRKLVKERTITESPGLIAAKLARSPFAWALQTLFFVVRKALDGCTRPSGPKGDPGLALLMPEERFSEGVLLGTRMEKVFSYTFQANENEVK